MRFEEVNGMLRELVEEDIVDQILVLKPVGQGVVHALVEDVNALSDASPFAPLMPVNGAAIVSQITRLTPSEKRIGVVLRPCEIRTLIELVKLKQASLENIFVIGIDCPGTYSLRDYKRLVDEGVDPIEKLGKDPPLSTACRVCERFEPQNFDLALSTFGSDKVYLRYGSERGKAALEKLGRWGEGDKERGKDRERDVSQMRERKLKAWSDLSGDVSKMGLDKLDHTLSTCINCYNCMAVCPICYCQECIFKSSTFRYESDKYARWVKRKGSFRVPADTLLFHLTRMNHVSMSCTACGMCEQACPSDIPLLGIFKLTSQGAQKLFDYEAGRSIDEEIPLVVYEEEEFE